MQYITSQVCWKNVVRARSNTSARKAFSLPMAEQAKVPLPSAFPLVKRSRLGMGRKGKFAGDGEGRGQENAAK